MRSGIPPFPRLLSILLPVVLPLAGCVLADPLTAPGLWHPNGANDANLLASVENPGDLVRGRSDPARDPNPVLAVLRYRAGAPKPLPASGLAEIKLTPSDDNVSAPAATANAASAGDAADGQ